MDLKRLKVVLDDIYIKLPGLKQKNAISSLVKENNENDCNLTNKELMEESDLQSSISTGNGIRSSKRQKSSSTSVTPIKRRKSERKTRPTKIKKEDDEVTEEQEDDDEIPEEKEDDDEIPEEKSEDLCDYEKMIEKNRLERLKMLEDLQLLDIKQELKQAVEVKKKPSAPRIRKVYSSLEPVRKSERLANVKLNLSEEFLSGRALEQMERSISTTKTLQYIRPYSKEEDEEIVPLLSFKDALRVNYSIDSFNKDIPSIKSEAPAEFVNYDVSTVLNLDLPEGNIAKVTPDRITALSWYPLPSPFLLAAGTKYGNLGIWNVDGDSIPYLFKNHVAGTTNLQFNLDQPHQLFSSSYDGTLRIGDLEKQVFTLLYESPDAACTYFDFFSPSTCLVSQRNGCIVVVDNRLENDGKQRGKLHECHDYTIKCISNHPLNKHYFVTSSTKSPVRLWDLRKLQKKPVAEIKHHTKIVNSAYFSRVTGNSIVTTSADDSIAIFDSTNITADIQLKHHIMHNNFTSRWLSVFRAKWLPNSDDIFVVGSMDQERRIHVYDCKQNKMNSLIHPYLTICSLLDGHPSRTALAGANSSGKVFAFAAKQ